MVEIQIPPATPPPEPTVPAYIWAIIVIGVTLSITVIVLIAKPFGLAPVHSYAGKNAESMVKSLRIASTPVRTHADSGKAKETEADKSLSFAAKSFLRRFPLIRGKKNGEYELSGIGTQKQGEIIVSRIRNMAEEHLLYKEFPRGAALFFHLWALFGSRDETNRYLQKSFHASTNNVIEFLKCYLPTSSGLPATLPDGIDFSQTQYDEIAEVVDPDKVFVALVKLYGSNLHELGCDEHDAPLEKRIACRFADIHHSRAIKRL